MGCNLISSSSHNDSYNQPPYELSTPQKQSSLEFQTAFEAYEVAKIAALKWDKTSILYKIPATFIMEQNLGFPVTGEGWFFMFKNPTSPLEYYVYVWNGKISGTTEAQPIYLDSPPDELNPLTNLFTLLDSDKVHQITQTNLADKNPEHYNLELVFEKSSEYPKWIIYNISTLPGKVVATINALNGEIKYSD